jgi:hypothetical protein
MEIRICVRLWFSKLVGSQHYEPPHINTKEAQIQPSREDWAEEAEESQANAKTRGSR